MIRRRDQNILEVLGSLEGLRTINRINNGAGVAGASTCVSLVVVVHRSLSRRGRFNPGPGLHWGLYIRTAQRFNGTASLFVAILDTLPPCNSLLALLRALGPRF